MNRLTPIAVLISGFSGLALAQGLPLFEQVDANGDGAISREEASVIEALDFDAVDANQDGSLDREEYAAAAQQ